MIDLYTWTTGNSRKIPIFLEEAALPYRLHMVDIHKDEQFKPEFVAICPNSKVPAIVDQDGPGGKPLALFESGAILIYLADKTGRFMPRDGARRYRAIEWVMFQMANVGPLFGQAHHFLDKTPQPIPYAIDRYVKEAARLYHVMEKRLGEVEYLAGDYSIADMTTYVWLRKPEHQGQKLKDYPNIKRWFGAIHARPAGDALAQRLHEQWRGPDSQKCAVIDCTSSSPSPTPPSNDSEGIDARYDKIHKDAVRVWNEATAYSSLNAKMDSYQYALQLFRQQQALRDGANVRDAISQLETLILWTSGVTNDQNKNYGTAVSELLKAYRSRPELFTEGNYNYIAAVETRFALSAPNASLRLFPDPSTVDARDAQSGLPTALENAVTGAFSDSPPGVSDRVRKGFQAVMANDWKVARAWFQDALNRDPGNTNLKSFIVSVDLTPGEALDLIRKDKIEKIPLSSFDATKLSKKQIVDALNAILLDASCPNCR